MKKMIKVVVIVGFIFAVSSRVKAEELEVNSTANIAIEANTGKILSEKNSNEKLAIASVSKIITMYMTLDKIKENKELWNEKVGISDYLIELSKDYSLGSLPLSENFNYTVRDLFYAMSVVSSNSAAMALGEWVAPDHSQTTYIRMANDWLKSLGLSDFSYVSASGLENFDIPGYNIDGTTLDDYNKFSARDVSIIARELINTYPEILSISTTEDYIMGDGTPLSGGSRAFKGHPDYDSTLNVDGLKTGYTSIAGPCFVGTEDNGEFRTISVVLNSENYAKETNQLLHYARDNYTKIQIRTEDYSVINKDLDLKITYPSSYDLIVRKDGAEVSFNKKSNYKEAKVGDKVVLGDFVDKADPLGYISNENKSLNGEVTKVNFSWKCIIEDYFSSEINQYLPKGLIQRN